MPPVFISNQLTLVLQQLCSYFRWLEIETLQHLHLLPWPHSMTSHNTRPLQFVFIMLMRIPSFMRASRKPTLQLQLPKVKQTDSRTKMLCHSLKVCSCQTTNCYLINTNLLISISHLLYYTRQTFICQLLLSSKLKYILRIHSFKRS